jgi:hypothetical protein
VASPAEYGASSGVGEQPGVLVRLRLGGVIALPWDSTDLPVPELEDHARPDGPPPALLSPSALRNLARFLQHRKHYAAGINQLGI